MNSSQFKKNEFKKFCATVGFKSLAVEQLIDKMENYYKEWAEQKIDKKTQKVKKYKDGTVKKRIVRPSLNELKRIQANIKSRILVPIKLPDCIHGGVKKKSNVSNSKPHQGKKYCFTTDLLEFFPSISSQMVYDAFITLKFSPHYSHWLTTLTTWKYELPQGTPTSTHIANLVFLETDQKIIELCNKNGLTYTRYIDDLTFSSPQDFSHLLNDILKIITSNHFKINYRKTKYSDNQTVTGIDVFLNKIDGPTKIIERSKEEVIRNCENKPVTNYLNSIRKTNVKKKKIVPKK